jgi:hypothetical protein
VEAATQRCARPSGASLQLLHAGRRIRCVYQAVAVSIVRWTEPHFKSELTPVKVERHDRKQERKKELEDAYAIVNERDRNLCWVTGAHLDPAAVDPRNRREHHHLKGRRVRPEWVTRPERIILVSALAHDLITKGWIAVEGTDARKPIFFHYTELAKSKPIVIKRRNVRAE